jgi:hypothetical protein
MKKLISTLIAAFALIAVVNLTSAGTITLPYVDPGSGDRFDWAWDLHSRMNSAPSSVSGNPVWKQRGTGINHTGSNTMRAGFDGDGFPRTLDGGNTIPFAAGDVIKFEVRGGFSGAAGGEGPADVVVETNFSYWTTTSFPVVGSRVYLNVPTHKGQGVGSDIFHSATVTANRAGALNRIAFEIRAVPTPDRDPGDLWGNLRHIKIFKNGSLEFEGVPGSFQYQRWNPHSYRGFTRGDSPVWRTETANLSRSGETATEVSTHLGGDQILNITGKEVVELTLTRDPYGQICPNGNLNVELDAPISAGGHKFLGNLEPWQKGVPVTFSIALEDIGAITSSTLSFLELRVRGLLNQSPCSADASKSLDSGDAVYRINSLIIRCPTCAEIEQAVIDCVCDALIASPPNSEQELREQLESCIGSQCLSGGTVEQCIDQLLQ